MAATEEPPPFFSILSLNVNKRSDLAGLVVLLRETRPDLVFLQEVNIPLQRLAAAVSGLGFSAWLSSCQESRRNIAVLSRHPDIGVSDIIPGFLQQVHIQDIYFLHFHCPSGTNEYNTRIQHFAIARTTIVSLPTIPVLVGDCNDPDYMYSIVYV